MIIVSKTNATPLEHNSYLGDVINQSRTIYSAKIAQPYLVCSAVIDVDMPANNNAVAAYAGKIPAHSGMGRLQQ